MMRKSDVSSCMPFLLLFISGKVCVADGSVAELAKSTTTDNCYTFSATNHAANKKITDIHFSGGAGKKVPGEHTRAPLNWDASNDAIGDLVFKTPPDSAPAAAGTTSKPAENPIGTGQTLGGFRFCLPKKLGLNYSISYSDGTLTSPSSFGSVPVGGVVTHNYTLTCVKVKVTAPTDTAACDVIWGVPTGVRRLMTSNSQRAGAGGYRMTEQAWIWGWEHSA